MNRSATARNQLSLADPARPRNGTVEKILARLQPRRTRPAGGHHLSSHLCLSVVPFIASVSLGTGIPPRALYIHGAVGIQIFDSHVPTVRRIFNQYLIVGNRIAFPATSSTYSVYHNGREALVAIVTGFRPDPGCDLMRTSLVVQC